MDALAEFVAAADSTSLPDKAPMLLRRNVLDSIGCAIAALDGETVRLVREQVESVGGLPRASLIGGGRPRSIRPPCSTRSRCDTWTCSTRT